MKLINGLILMIIIAFLAVASCEPFEDVSNVPAIKFKEYTPYIQVLDTEENNLINQVGYHNHFIGTFRELKRLIKSGILGDLVHFTGEAYGPVVIKPKGGTWRSDPGEGGGCLFDYASHVI